MGANPGLRQNFLRRSADWPAVGETALVDRSPRPLEWGTISRAGPAPRLPGRNQVASTGYDIARTGDNRYPEEDHHG